MTPATATRLTADERRDAIVVAAMHAFAEGGYAGTSVESIARAVGVSQPYLFQLYGTKRDLFLAAVRHGFRRVQVVFHEATKDAPPPDRPDCTTLELMGHAYKRLLSDRDLLRVQLQAYAACGDEDVRQVVREDFAALYELVKRESGASDEAIHQFFAEGMLLNVAAALELGGTPETWSLARLLRPEQVAAISKPGGAA
jgi:AcrR family transcriptional regulator